MKKKTTKNPKIRENVMKILKIACPIVKTSKVTAWVNCLSSMIVMMKNLWLLEEL